MGNRARQSKKKQGVPEIPLSLRTPNDDKKKLSSRAKARAKKRQLVAKKREEKKRMRRLKSSLEREGNGEFVAENEDDSGEAVDEIATEQKKRKRKTDLPSPDGKDENNEDEGEDDGDEDDEDEGEDDGDENDEDEGEDDEGESIQKDVPDKAQLFDDQSDLEDETMVQESKELEERAERDKVEGNLEFQMNVRLAGEEIMRAIDKDVDNPEIMETKDPAQIWACITEIVRVLSQFSELRDPAKSRAEYIEQLVKCVKAYYGYNDFMAERIIDMFPPSELLSFLDANETPRPVTIRANLLLTTLRDLHKSLMARGMNADRIGEWSRVGLQVFDSKVPIGATPEYMSGMYIIQAASSFLPVMALGACENEKILDMCASPGGKTTHIAMYMKNTGCIVANDVNKDRCKALVANIHRTGVRNAVVSNLDGRKFPKMVSNFDRVLLDAPCTGSGVSSKDSTIKASKSEQDLTLLTHTQKELILAAIDSVTRSTGTNGVVVYSTCSILVEENEEIIDYALKKRPNVQLEDTGIQIGTPAFVSYRGKSFSPLMKLAKRVYPHTHNLDGFFVAKLRKITVLPSHKPVSDSETHFQNFPSSKKKSNVGKNVSNGKVNIKMNSRAKHRKRRKSEK